MGRRFEPDGAYVETHGVIAVIGQGEIGSAIAGSLAAAGATVIGYDPAPPEAPSVPIADRIEDAVAEAKLVLTINSSTVAARVAEQIAPHLAEQAVYADLNAGTPALKEKLAGIIGAERFVDGAVMAPPPELAIALAGPAAKQLTATLEPFGLRVEYVSAVTGEAAARQLTRSILSKCIAGVVVDFMWAAEAMGLSTWAYQELLDEFEALSANDAKRFLSETVANPKRREIEMLDIVEMLEHAKYHSIYVPPTQLVYNKLYHSIKVPFGTEAEQKQFEGEGTAAAASDSGW